MGYQLDAQRVIESVQSIDNQCVSMGIFEVLLKAYRVVLGEEQ